MLETLKKYWGFNSFRPLQEEIIQSVLDGQDTLALLPTGGGKSICFQVPALMQEGICIVVSPLIALMKDQVGNLKKRGIAAEAIYSGMYYKDIDRILDNCVYGDVKFLYLSPERLETDLAKERLSKMNVNLLAIDEAHCISQWGYDFRPSYLNILKTRDYLPNVPVLALTATATEDVVKDIQSRLGFISENVFQKSFKRDNLSYVVLDEQAKAEKMLNILQKVQGSSVVYVRNRRGTKEIAQYLQRNRIEADFYHAGIPHQERADKQDKWLSGHIRVMVATNAFGMGIDKPDVRSVIHLDVPDNLEAYFQEAGRAGRDGEKAYAVLLYNVQDKQKLERQYEQTYPDMEEVRRVYNALGSYFQLAIGSGSYESLDFDIVTFVQRFKLDMVKTFNALKLLEQNAWLLLNESVFEPAKLKILLSGEELYDYRLKNKRFDALLNAISRNYQGAFSNYVNVRIPTLADYFGRNVSDIIKDLAFLHQRGVVLFKPQKDSPQIFFLKERDYAENLSIDQALLDFRKKRHAERLQKVIAYCEHPICRSQQLLQYFGEFESENCGTCDVCLGRNKTTVNQNEFDQYFKKIKYILEKENLDIHQIVSSFSPKHRKRVVKVLDQLLQENLILQNAQGKIQLNS